jgi:hypothetical protein
LEVPDADWAEGLMYGESGEDVEKWKARTWQQTVDFARRQSANEKIDMFLSYLFPQQVDTGAVKDLQGMGIRCVNFFCDNVREFRKVPAAFAPFDLHWVPEYEALAMYRRASLPHIHAAMPCWVPERLRVPAERETGPAVFIGSADVLRRNFFGRAISAGANFVLHGKGWEAGDTNPAGRTKSGDAGLLKTQMDFVKRNGLGGIVNKIIDKVLPPSSFAIPASKTGRTLSPEEYVRLTREAPVVLGTSCVPSPKRPLWNPLRYSRLRDIEAPMLGACYLTEYTEGLAAFYDLGSEVETYRSSEELAEKLEYLGKTPAKRKQLRMAGQKRALSDHSVPASLDKIVRRLAG